MEILLWYNVKSVSLSLGISDSNENFASRSEGERMGYDGESDSDAADLSILRLFFHSTGTQTYGK